VTADNIVALVFGVIILLLVIVPPVVWWLDARRQRRANEQERKDLIVEGMRYGVEYVPGEDLGAFRTLVICARDKAAEKEGRRA